MYNQNTKLATFALGSNTKIVIICSGINVTVQLVLELDRNNPHTHRMWERWENTCTTSFFSPREHYYDFMTAEQVYLTKK